MPLKLNIFEIKNRIFFFYLNFKSNHAFFHFYLYLQTISSFRSLHCLGKSIMLNKPVRFQVGRVWACNIKLIHMTHRCYLKRGHLPPEQLTCLINTSTLLTARTQTSTASEHLYMTHMYRCTFT